MVNIYNNNKDIHCNQKIYDNFNDFIFSNDRNVFNKLHSKYMFYDMTKDLIGDIVECGVFKGSGMVSWLKLLDLHEPNSIKKVIGFDFFDPTFVEFIDDQTDKDAMQQVFSRCEVLDNSELSISSVNTRMISAGFDSSRFELIKGDIMETARVFCERPGFRISILNLDLDLAEPTYQTLENFWPRIVPNGIIILDEYAYHNWSEANGVDRFVREHGLKIHKTNIKAPTAYIVKS